MFNATNLYETVVSVLGNFSLFNVIAVAAVMLLTIFAEFYREVRHMKIEVRKMQENFDTYFKSGYLPKKQKTQLETEYQKLVTKFSMLTTINEGLKQNLEILTENYEISNTRIATLEMMMQEIVDDNLAKVAKVVESMNQNGPSDGFTRKKKRVIELIDIIAAKYASLNIQETEEVEESKEEVQDATN